MKCVLHGVIVAVSTIVICVILEWMSYVHELLLLNERTSIIEVPFWALAGSVLFLSDL